MHYNTLRHTATHCIKLQHTATHKVSTKERHSSDRLVRRSFWFQHTLQQTATHCITLQRTASHCNALHHTATYCNAQSVNEGEAFGRQISRQGTFDFSTHCNTLQHTATHCNALQHTATLCITLQHTATHKVSRKERHSGDRSVDRNFRFQHTLQHSATLCNNLHHTATRCNAQSVKEGEAFERQIFKQELSISAHTATHCNTLQHTATHCNTQQHTVCCSAWSTVWNELKTDGPLLPKKTWKVLLFFFGCRSSVQKDRYTYCVVKIKTWLEWLKMIKKRLQND